jgi:hypothetical protein
MKVRPGPGLSNTARVERLSDFADAETVANLALIQPAAEAAPKSDALELLRLGEEASARIDLDEAATRALIDQQLRDSDWEADTKTLRYGLGSRPAKGRNFGIMAQTHCRDRITATFADHDNDLAFTVLIVSKAAINALLFKVGGLHIAAEISAINFNGRHLQNGGKTEGLGFSGK